MATSLGGAARLRLAVGAWRSRSCSPLPVAALRKTVIARSLCPRLPAAVPAIWPRRDNAQALGPPPWRRWSCCPPQEPGRLRFPRLRGAVRSTFTQDTIPPNYERTPPLVFKIASPRTGNSNRFTGSTTGPSSRRSRSTRPRRPHRLVDKFHAENTYLICLSGRKLAGMLAVRGNRPFSLDQKLADLDSYLPPAGRKVCEIRLLAIEKKFRGAQVLQGILALLWQHGIEKGYDLAIISGTTRQFKLYQHLGFVPFGPVVGSGRRAVPADVRHAGDVRGDRARIPALLAVARSFQPSAVNFLPGPVTVRREVRRAFEQAPESHRARRLHDGLPVREAIALRTGPGAQRGAVPGLRHAGQRRRGRPALARAGSPGWCSATANSASAWWTTRGGSDWISKPGDPLGPAVRPGRGAATNCRACPRRAGSGARIARPRPVCSTTSTPQGAVRGVTERSSAWTASARSARCRWT